jgi:TrpR-related protein YerC/YecD
MNNKNWKNQYSTSLFKVILKLKNINEVSNFFRDLLTEKEIVEFSQRWRVAKMLNKKIPYYQIEKETGLSSTTIARINKWLKTGTGGYKTMINR